MRVDKTDLLDGILVLDMAQFLSGPSAALRMADLGARVIKIERPGTGDICRQLYLSDTDVLGDSTLFHAINRNKESFAADLKSSPDLDAVRTLIASADVLIQNFRPGVIERLGLGYDHIRNINPRLVYASISGYGEDGPWSGMPGQDLLAQAVSGLMWLTGDQDDGPVPMGLSITDMLAGHAVVEGVLAALVRRGITGEGTHIQTSLLEASIDLQFEVLTTYLNDGGKPPVRAGFRNAHPGLSAPYGVYPTKDGFLALSMTPLDVLAGLLDLPQLAAIAAEPRVGFTRRDDIKGWVAGRLARESTGHWLAKLGAADVWCSAVLDWPQLLRDEAFRRLDILQTLCGEAGERLETTSSPIRVQGRRRKTTIMAPTVGEHTDAIRREFNLPAARS